MFDQCMTPGCPLFGWPLFLDVKSARIEEKPTHFWDPDPDSHDFRAFQLLYSRLVAGTGVALGEQVVRHLSREQLSDQDQNQFAGSKMVAIHIGVMTILGRNR